MKTYSEKLRDPRWKRRSFECKASRGDRCQECGQTREECCESLETHHVIYLRGVEPWDYPDELLRVVCRTCHVDRQVEDEEAMVEFARYLCRHNWHEVRSIAKRLRLFNEAGKKIGEPWAKLFDSLASLRGEKSVQTLKK
jgi:5-methylcytosine-specific restriction endonuclease McrA